MDKKKKRKREVYTGLTDLEKWQVGQARGGNGGELAGYGPRSGSRSKPSHYYLERVRSPESLAKAFEGKAAGVLSASVKEQKRRNRPPWQRQGYQDVIAMMYSGGGDVARDLVGKYKNRFVSPSREATSRASILRSQARSLRNPDVAWPDVRGKK